MLKISIFAAPPLRKFVQTS